MRLRELESELSKVAGFEKPKMELEQYATSGHIAAQLVHRMQDEYGDVEGKTVCDLGCGTGMLSIACALQDAAHVVGVDGDQEALDVADRNIGDMQLGGLVDVVRADVVQGVALRDKAFDVVVMNPPFGTKRRGADVAFLRAAVQLASETVYSLHKTSTRAFISRRAASWGARGEVSKQTSATREHTPATTFTDRTAPRRATGDRRAALRPAAHAALPQQPHRARRGGRMAHRHATRGRRRAAGARARSARGCRTANIASPPRPRIEEIKKGTRFFIPLSQSVRRHRRALQFIVRSPTRSLFQPLVTSSPPKSARQPLHM